MRHGGTIVGSYQVLKQFENMENRLQFILTDCDSLGVFLELE